MSYRLFSGGSRTGEGSLGSCVSPCLQSSVSVGLHLPGALGAASEGGGHSSNGITLQRTHSSAREHALPRAMHGPRGLRHDGGSWEVSFDGMG